MLPMTLMLGKVGVSKALLPLIIGRVSVVNRRSLALFLALLAFPLISLRACGLRIRLRALDRHAPSLGVLPCRLPTFCAPHHL